MQKKKTCKTEEHTRFSYTSSFVSYHKNMTLGQKTTTLHFSLNFIKKYSLIKLDNFSVILRSKKTLPGKHNV